MCLLFPERLWLRGAMPAVPRRAIPVNQCARIMAETWRVARVAGAPWNRKGADLAARPLPSSYPSPGYMDGTISFNAGNQSPMKVCGQGTVSN